MRWWPWQREETRASFSDVEQRASFTDAITSALVQAAAGTSQRPTASAALEAAAGNISRGFAVATVEGSPAHVSRVLTPDFMSLVARDLIRNGESLFLIDVDREGLALRPSGSHDVRGGPAEDSWFYRLDLYGPSGNITRLVPGESVLHFRYSVDPARPWLGVSPMSWSSGTGNLHAGVEGALRRDMTAASAHVLPMPAGAEGEPTDDDEQTDDADDPIRAAIRDAAGKSVFVESTQGSHGGDYRDRPAQDWQQKRLGPDPPDALSTLLGQTANMVLSAAGVAPIIAGLERGDGTLAREAYRRFERLTLQPMGRLLEPELRRKLDAPGLSISFASLRSSDFAGLARAYKALKESGMSAAEINELLDLGGTNAQT